MKILVVDDDSVSRIQLKAILEQVGACTAVDCGVAAIDAFMAAVEQGSPFGLITLDFSMPDMDGPEVLQRIRAEEEQRGLPKEQRVKVIMVSVVSDRDSLVACVEAGCDDYITKPFDQLLVLKTVERQIHGMTD